MWPARPGDLGPRLRAGGASSTRRGGDAGGWARVPRHRCEIRTDRPTLTSFPRRREPRSRLNSGARTAEMARAAAGVICRERAPRGPVTWAPAIVPEARLRHDAGVTLAGGVRASAHHRSEMRTDQPTPTSCPRRRAPRTHRNAGVRAAGMARAAGVVICGECSPCGSVTWAPAFAGVTLVGGVRECLNIAVKSKPIVQHWRHARVAHPTPP